MDGKMLARLGAVVFVAVAVTATAIELTRKQPVPATAPVLVLRPEANQLHERQRRCQQLGLKAAEDVECLRVWAETRDLFLGRTPVPPAPRIQEER
ncbi:putative entry exclusion protein TrbK-alt [Aminobacter sp. NyZ550]|jgi:conjugative transfer region protein TrbK|uniref:Conjugative transfer region protein TrbK n=2 Tax=Aminobacter TaxID=31988 RepID=A0AAC9ATD7_AMIAI|nr:MULTISPECIES: putative entry exclusion protein TrbK-alt [Aminobacter]AMS44026.1 Entry exclusion protein TrbK [Aminobacter aminovorans]MBA8907771.1 conjugative transfer region protein TrbK [Aminobacter ciceronei]MBA9021543.1 conjugative transfer region protein TrbK [Aminobacter ciceronei]MBB3705583.1 conjugative transfer region protein TrbK [Aminobacter aminovorans]MDR7224462.1 conjugative transfer region protein TrbK [Aminobacter aminovorans]